MKNINRIFISKSIEYLSLGRKDLGQTINLLTSHYQGIPGIWHQENWVYHLKWKEVDRISSIWKWSVWKRFGEFCKITGAFKKLKILILIELEYGMNNSQVTFHNRSIRIAAECGACVIGFNHINTFKLQLI